MICGPLKEQLDAAGFWVSEVIDHGFIHSIYAFDPNGIPIEFSSTVTGINLRETPRMVDSAPSTVTLQGPEPQMDQWPAPVTTSPEERGIFPGEGLELVQPKKNWWERRG